MTAKKNVLVVEDEPLVRSLVASQLAQAGFNVFVATDAASARDIESKNAIDVAVLDIQLGNGPTGFDLAAILRSNAPELAIVFLTHVPHPRLIGSDATRIPKNAAYLVKSMIAESSILVEAIEAALNNNVGPSHRNDKTSASKFTSLSRSQIAILKLMADGLSNREIAEARETTLRAVERLITRAMTVAEIESDSGQLRVRAVREYLIQTGQLRP